MPVYFIQAGENGPVKVGYAVCVESRLATLQTAHPQKLIVLRVMERAGIHEEKRLHKLYKKRKIRGEWFLFHWTMLKIRHESLAARLNAKPPFPRCAIIKENAALFQAVRSVGGQAVLARGIKVSRQRIHAWLWHGRPISPEYCVAIERETGGMVTRKSLRPDFPWGDL